MRISPLRAARQAATAASRCERLPRCHVVSTPDPAHSSPGISWARMLAVRTWPVVHDRELFQGAALQAGVAQRAEVDLHLFTGLHRISRPAAGAHQIAGAGHLHHPDAGLLAVLESAVDGQADVRIDPAQFHDGAVDGEGLGCGRTWWWSGAPRPTRCRRRRRQAPISANADLTSCFIDKLQMIIPRYFGTILPQMVFSTGTKTWSPLASTRSE